jgi:hypothetical protein
VNCSVSLLRDCNKIYTYTSIFHLILLSPYNLLEDFTSLWLSNVKANKEWEIKTCI